MQYATPVLEASPWPAQKRPAWDAVASATTPDIKLIAALAAVLAARPNLSSGRGIWLRNPNVVRLLRGLAIGTIPLTHDE